MIAITATSVSTVAVSSPFNLGDLVASENLRGSVSMFPKMRSTVSQRSHERTRRRRRSILDCQRKADNSRTKTHQHRFNPRVLASRCHYHYPKHINQRVRTGRWAYRDGHLRTQAAHILTHPRSQQDANVVYTPHARCDIQPA